MRQACPRPRPRTRADAVTPTYLHLRLLRRPAGVALPPESAAGALTPLDTIVAYRCVEALTETSRRRGAGSESGQVGAGQGSAPLKIIPEPPPERGALLPQ